MIKKTLVAAVVLGLSATAAFAQAQQAERPARASLDANADGVVDRAEAAKFPRLAQKFDQLDKNGDGRLDAGERSQRHGKHRGKRHGGHGGVQRLDTDGDGRLSRDEVAAGKSGRDGKNRLLENFDAIDANRDGHVVRTELHAWGEKQRPQMQAKMQQRFDERFVAADLNRDGKLSRVEVDEKMPRTARSFAWMDDNRDGFLSREELRPQRHR